MPLLPRPTGNETRATAPRDCPDDRRRPRRRAALVAATTGIAVLAAGAPVAYATLGSAATPEPRPAVASAVRGKDYIETRLLFGTERPDGGPDVTDRQFLDFIDSEVTPRFPNGLTIQNGRGQWRDSNGVIERERSYELTLLYPASEARVRGPQIERIRDAYEKAYAQDSVARLEERLNADF
ncbi:DUF3574 domain-containing protein [Streptomyces castrisilvae]|uniref:DUF3574 domain-containing protein n=1 Tax=Streptomyces castrisilvae TaxID=3033811 RepID=A0ABY9HFA7_9ACTN|nr:DUF3574 domain-containing protein [Streptomyces sp. Mut1]WLQ33200.1 DUF3574 domain-containing protein [Streptomyces sp. Mut1]